MLKLKYLLTEFGFDKVENGPAKVDVTYLSPTAPLLGQTDS